MVKKRGGVGRSSGGKIVVRICVLTMIGGVVEVCGFCCLREEESMWIDGDRES